MYVVRTVLELDLLEVLASLRIHSSLECHNSVITNCEVRLSLSTLVSVIAVAF